MIPLSIAMMVRNEEKNLERCLKSVMEFFALGIEIVILDTGSTDKTVEIAQKYTKNVYHQKWANNFSLHRNKSFSYCKGKWIFQLDADEEIIWAARDGLKRFALALERIPEKFNAISFPMKDYRQSQDSYVAELDITRIFRNGHVTYKRRVHNDPQFEGDTVYMPDVFFLKHYGYDLNPEQKKQKAARTISLLEAEVAENPDDYECYFYLCQAYGSWTNDVDSAVKYAKKYIEHKNDIGATHFKSHIYHFLAAVRFNEDDAHGALEWISAGLKDDPRDLDLNFDLMIAGIKTKNPSYIATGSANFVRTYRDFKEYRFKNPGKFFFYYNISALAEALYYQIRSHLTNAMMERKNLSEILKQCPQQLAAEIREKLDQTYEECKLSNERKIVTPVEHLNQMLQKAPVAGSLSAVVGPANRR